MRRASPLCSDALRFDAPLCAQPVVAGALRLLYHRFGDDWFVQLLFDDVKAWLDWFWRTRRLAPLGLIALGSDPGAMASKYNAPSLKMAKLESGMDNSPMYACHLRDLARSPSHRLATSGR